MMKIYEQFGKMPGGIDQGQYDFEQTILLNKVMFEDKMYLKTGYSGQDLERAIHKFGIYAERMK